MPPLSFVVMHTWRSRDPIFNNPRKTGSTTLATND